MFPLFSGQNIITTSSNPNLSYTPPHKISTLITTAYISSGQSSGLSSFFFPQANVLLKSLSTSSTSTQGISPVHILVKQFSALILYKEYHLYILYSQQFTYRERERENIPEIFTLNSYATIHMIIGTQLSQAYINELCYLKCLPSWLLYS